LPPLRAGFELRASHGPWQAGLCYTCALAQNRPGLRETSTDGYDRLDLTMSYDWKATNRKKLLLFGKASNMTQSVILNFTSFLRNFAPEPGFSFEMGFRATF
jgi:iron complex outermembrane recepter protein